MKKNNIPWAIVNSMDGPYKKQNKNWSWGTWLWGLFWGGMIFFPWGLIIGAIHPELIMK